jgi:hypothetical protein
MIEIAIDATVIDRLVKWRWLKPRDMHERSEIAAAIGRMIADAATSSSGRN